MAGYGQQRDSGNREYRTEEIVVTWEPDLCVHARECVRGLPAVFHPRERPWVTLRDADAYEIARVVAACPSRALKYQFLREQQGESAGASVTR